MGLTSNLISSLLLISYSTAKNLKFPKLVNDNVIRNLDLSSSYLKETISVVIASEEAKPISDYYFSTPLSTNGSIAKLEVIDKKDKKVLETELSKVQEDKQYYQVKLNSPVTSEEKQAIAIKIYYFDSVKPYPQTIQHTESQKFLFEGNAYFDSPFTSKKQKTSLKLPSVTVHSHTKNPEPALLNKNILTYGPYSDIEANKESTVKVHYDSSKPYIYATEAHRDIELNHWTKDIWVEENYSITNKGPKLTGEFSRVTHAYSKMQALNTATYLESLEMDLPFDSNEAYFRDQIGNVSTSNFRLSKSKSKPANFVITPRYPIYGGWKYTWYQGYHLNLFNHVSEASSPDTYTLSFPLLQNFVNTELPIEKFSWKLILPERAELISYDISLPGAKIETIRHYGLLDSVGRTSLLITVDNVGDFSQSQLTFTYQYTFFAMIQKPLVALSFAFGLIALAVIAYNGLSSLKFDSKKKAKKTN